MLPFLFLWRFSTEAVFVFFQMMEHAKKNGANRHDVAEKLPGFIKKGSQ